MYSSHIDEWRPARDAGELPGPARPAAGPKDAQISRLTKENQQLGQELSKARLVVEVQSKLSDAVDIRGLSPSRGAFMLFTSRPPSGVSSGTRRR